MLSLPTVSQKTVERVFGQTGSTDSRDGKLELIALL
jgi:hypothetical protein